MSVALSYTHLTRVLEELSYSVFERASSTQRFLLFFIYCRRKGSICQEVFGVLYKRAFSLVPGSHLLIRDHRSEAVAQHTPKLIEQLPETLIKSHRNHAPSLLFHMFMEHPYIARNRSQIKLEKAGQSLLT